MKIKKSRLKEIVKEEVLREAGKMAAAKKIGKKVWKKVGPHVKDIASSAAKAAANRAGEKLMGSPTQGGSTEEDIEETIPAIASAAGAVNKAISGTIPEDSVYESSLQNEQDYEKVVIPGDIKRFMNPTTSFPTSFFT